MSATLPNIQDVAAWLNARLFKTTWRPVELQERLLLGQEVGQGNASQPVAVLLPILSC
jgi:replicative superfamily II helicase